MLVKLVLSGVGCGCCCKVVLLAEAVGRVRMLKGSVDVLGFLRVVMGKDR